MKIFHLLLISTIVLTSCYTEDRIKPTQTKLTAVTVTSYVNGNNSNNNSNNNNSNNSTTPIYLANYNYSNSQKVDSNGNGKYSSFVTNISTVFNKAGKFKYSLYGRSYNTSTFYLLGTSGLINIPNNLSYNFSKKFYGDSLSSYLNSTNDYLSFYLVLQDSLGNYIQQSSSYSYSTSINYLSLGTIYTEPVKTDTVVSINVYNLSIFGTIDKNSNTYSQSFSGVTVAFTNNTGYYANASKYYLKIYYKPLNSTNKILYGITSTLTTPSSNYYYSNYYDGSFTPLVDTLSKGNYTFYVSIFDKTTNKEITQTNQYTFNKYLESKKLDNRTYSWGYLGTVIKDDADADAFPASYYFKVIIKASDSAKVNLTGTLNYASYGYTYFNTLVNNISVVTGDTATFLVTGGTSLSHNYYDLQFGITEPGSYNTIGLWDKTKVPKFNALPFETFVQD